MTTLRRVWRRFWPIAAAALIGFGAVFFSLGVAMDANEPINPDGAFLDLLLGLAAVVLVGFRHRAALPIAIAISAISGFSVTASGAVLLAVISISTRRRPLEIGAVAGVGVVSLMIVETVPAVSAATAFTPSGYWAETLVGGLVTYAILIAIGVAIGARRAELASLRRETASLRAGQEATAEGARLAERARIAAELHDDLGHRLSIIALHSAALEYRQDLSAAERSASVGAVRSAAQQALTGLRHTLGILAEPATQADPSPAVAERLEELIASTCQAGSPVAADLDQGLLAALPPELGRHVFRIVQECLTNALRHAPGRPVELQISVAAQELRVRVANELPTQPSGPSVGAGLGLAGIAERVRLVGGQLHLEPNQSGSFVVEAVLPWTR